MSDSQVTTLDEAPAVISPKVKAKAVVVSKPDADGKNYFNVLIHQTGDDSQSNIVEVSVDGYLTRIPRGIPCRISETVLHVLQNAVVTSYKKIGDDVTEVNIPRFPFSVSPA
jgi:hypothetical protein